MDMLNILLTAALLFMLFLTPSLTRRWYIKKRYITILDRYKEDYKKIEASRSQPNNVYNIEDYKKRIKNRGPDDIMKYSRTHILIWSDKLQEYTKVPKNTLIDDEDI